MNRAEKRQVVPFETRVKPKVAFKNMFTILRDHRSKSEGVFSPVPGPENRAYAGGRSTSSVVFILDHMSLSSPY